MTLLRWLGRLLTSRTCIGILGAIVAFLVGCSFIPDHYLYPFIVPLRLDDGKHDHPFIGRGRSNMDQPFSKAANELTVVDWPLERQTCLHFIEFIVTGVFMSGKRVEERSRLVEPKLLDVLMRPTKEWATSSLADIDYSIVDYMHAHIEANKVRTFAPICATKYRMWAGIPPMTPERWLMRRLDDPEHHSAAIQHISQVVKVFHFFDDASVQWIMRASFNGIYEILGNLSADLDIYRRSQEDVGPPINLTDLWRDFIEDYYDMITESARSWMTQHINDLIGKNMDLVRAHKPDEMRYPALIGPYDGRQWILTNRLHDLLELAVMAETAIRLPMEGYYGGASSKEGFSKDQVPHSDLHAPDFVTRHQYFGKMLKSESNRKIIQDIVDESTNGKDHLVEPRSANDPEQILQNYETQLWAHKNIRDLLWGNDRRTGTGQHPQPWLQRMSTLLDDTEGRLAHRDSDEQTAISTRARIGSDEPVSTQWGWVVYRMTYGQSEKDWDAFKEATLQEALIGWVEGTAGAAEVKDRFTLIWVEGHFTNIQEVWANFQTLPMTKGSDEKIWNPQLINRKAVVVIDDASWRSYVDARSAGELAHQRWNRTQKTRTERSDQLDIKPVVTDNYTSKYEQEQQAAKTTDIFNGASKNEPLDIPIPSSMSVSTPPPKPSSPNSATGMSGFFINVVDGDYSADWALAHEAPGYRGEMRVLTSLLVSDMYALYASSAASSFELWPLAMRHPQQIYVGPVARDDEAGWPASRKIGWIEWSLSFVFGARAAHGAAPGRPIVDGEL